MNVLINIIQFSLPLLIILAVVYIMLQYFSKQNRKQFDQLTEFQKLLRLEIDSDRREKSEKEILRMKLQAYERMVMFLERIHLPNLITRVMSAGFTSQQFQGILLKQIREEYEHNLSQQLYISAEAWELVKKAKEEVVSAINLGGSQVKSDDTAADLAKAILGGRLQSEADPIQKALHTLKEEVKSKL